MKIIQTLSGHLTDIDGNCYGIQPPTHTEMMDKINELVEVVNNLQKDIAYLKNQDEKRKKYKVIRRYDVLLLAKQKLKNGEYSGLCSALSSSLNHYGLSLGVTSCFSLYTIDQALRFGANKGNKYYCYWWKPGKFGILSGRLRYLNWLIRKYKNDPEILNTIEIYD
jgi:hypothetical protein